VLLVASPPPAVLLLLPVALVDPAAPPEPVPLAERLETSPPQLMPAPVARTAAAAIILARRIPGTGGGGDGSFAEREIAAPQNGQHPSSFT
jgi:hypothetical protein